MKKVSLLSMSKLKWCFAALCFSLSTMTLAEEKMPLPIDQVAGISKAIQFKDYLGKVVLIDFWASWCGPCRQSFPWMNEMQAKYKDQGLEIVAINLDNESEAAQDFLKEVPAHFTLAFDPEGVSAEKMQVEAMPMSYLIDRKGNISVRMIGFNSTNKIEHESHIQSLLKEAH